MKNGIVLSIGLLVLSLGASGARAESGIDLGGLLGGTADGGIDIGGLLGGGDEGGIDLGNILGGDGIALPGLVEADVAGIDLISGGSDALVDLDVIDSTGIKRKGPEVVAEVIVGKNLGLTDGAGGGDDLVDGVVEAVNGLTGGLLGGL